MNKILSLLPERINSIKIDLNRLSNKAQLSETLAKNPNLLSLSIVNFPLPLNASMNEINSKAQWDQGVFPAHIFLANSVSCEEFTFNVWQNNTVWFLRLYYKFSNYLFKCGKDGEESVDRIFESLRTNQVLKELTIDTVITLFTRSFRITDT